MFIIYIVFGDIMQCELCGKEVKNVTSARIEGVVMDVCENCLKYGVVVKNYSKDPGLNSNSSNYNIYNNNKNNNMQRNNKINKFRKDIFDNLKTVMEDYGEEIRHAREKRNLTTKELAKLVGMKESTLHKIERNELEPEEKYIKRLEKELKINLYEESSENEDYSNNNYDNTLSHKIKIKVRKK